MGSKRVRQVEEIVRRAAAQELLNSLPELATQVSLTRVLVTPDLRNATIWVGVRDTAKADELIELLQKRSHNLQRAVAAALSTKFTPKLTFRFDENADYADRIEELLNQA